MSNQLNNSGVRCSVKDLKKLEVEMHEKLKGVTRSQELLDVDGVPVSSTELHDFAMELRSQMRGIKFGPACQHYATVSYEVLSVYYEEDEFIIGQIGYAGYNGDLKYIVQSRTITNERFSKHNPLYHSRASNDAKRMIREAKKNLRRWNPQEVAAMSQAAAGEQMQGYLRKFERAEETARAKILGSSYTPRDIPIMAELRHLLKHDHEFVDPTFRSNVAAWVQAADELDTHDLRFPVKFVNVIQRFGRQVVNTVTTEFRHGNIYMSFANNNPLEVHTFEADDVPEDVVEKVSVLSMLHDGDYVEGIGYKHNDTAYWIHA